MIVQLIVVGRCQSIHDEDAVIDSDAEDERGDDDADEVETHIEQHHGSKHDEPTEQDGHEAQQSMLDVKAEAQQQHHKDKQHRQPLQHVEIVVHLQQRVGRIIIGVEHQQVRVAGNGVADADIVALAAAHGVVLAAHGGEAEIVAAIRLLHEC